ncbi:MAG: GNAT family N-acetyltransferase [Clostridia bacterium]|nr:GNAT family N-acetyltransferase [Clostridia bacterium]
MIRRAIEGDIPQILELLRQVNLVHYNARPDVFKKGLKYSKCEVEQLLKQADKPILVWTDATDTVKGYCFCVIKQVVDSNLLTDIKTLYIDDLCVDENCRGQGIGTALYNQAVSLAKELGCYNLTLNVWSCNPTALKFYQSLGLAPQKIFMEKIL